MRIPLPFFLIGPLTCLAGPAQAMNWEGHDDWMADMAPALLYEQRAPHARGAPKPQAACRDRHKEAEKNPYEQIPLAPRDCRASKEQAEPRP